MTRIAAVRACMAFAILLVAGCGELRRAAEELLDHRTPRERYVDALRHAGLSETALATDWTAAGERSLREAPLVTSNHEEQGYLAPGEPAAIALRIRVRRGQEVTFEMEMPGDTSTALYLDAWARDSTGAFAHVESADSGRRFLSVTPRRDSDIVFRAQPELLRGGRFRALVRVDPTLAFPVKSGTERDVGSRFGAPRDAGARSHHGIDIFATRGTPVVAAAPGVISRVNVTNLGGKVVWMRDVSGNSLYYAHLDSQAVSSGMRVEIGDTLGFVGNTGNARTTPPHLHFGVYRRGEGPVDPWWFVYQPRGTVPRLVADTARLGTWIRPSAARAILLSAPNARSDTVGLLARPTAMRVVSAVGDFYRVRLPDGVTGFVSARATESADRPITTVAVADSILARPAIATAPSDIVAMASEGETFGILGRFGDFALVRSSRGVSGWIVQDD